MDDTDARLPPPREVRFGDSVLLFVFTRLVFILCWREDGGSGFTRVGAPVVAVARVASMTGPSGNEGRHGDRPIIGEGLNGILPFPSAFTREEEEEVVGEEVEPH